jgi:hypothetical protein
VAFDTFCFTPLTRCMICCEQLGYLSEVLHMEEHYGLNTRMSSVGCAVLSHLPLGETKVYGMPTSRGEGEDGMVWAALDSSFVSDS